MTFLRLSSDPFESMMRLQRALSQSLTRPFYGQDWTPSGRGVFPPLNVFETGEGDAVLVRAELPGVEKDSIEVETVGNRVMIAGSRKLQEADERSRYHRRERQAGEFRRVFTLPFEINRESASASYTDGMLTVRVEKAESARPRQIKISG